MLNTGKLDVGLRAVGEAFVCGIPGNAVLDLIKRRCVGGLIEALCKLFRVAYFRCVFFGYLVYGLFHLSGYPLIDLCGIVCEAVGKVGFLYKAVYVKLRDCGKLLIGGILVDKSRNILVIPVKHHQLQAAQANLGNAEKCRHVLNCGVHAPYKLSECFFVKSVASKVIGIKAIGSYENSCRLEHGIASLAELFLKLFRGKAHELCHGIAARGAACSAFRYARVAQLLQLLCIV